MAGDLETCAKLKEEYNEASLIASIHRVQGMHVMDDPILVNVKDGMYVVHDSQGMETWARDDIQVYTKEAFDKKFTDQKPLSYAQLVEDRDVINDNRFHERMPGVVTSYKLGAMDLRIENIEKSVAEFEAELDKVSGVEKLPDPPSDDSACKF